MTTDVMIKKLKMLRKKMQKHGGIINFNSEYSTIGITWSLHTIDSIIEIISSKKYTAQSLRIWLNVSNEVWSVLREKENRK